MAHKRKHESDDDAPEGQGQRFCTLGPRVPRPVPAGVGGHRLQMIRKFESKWVSGTKITYAMYASGKLAPPTDKAGYFAAVRKGVKVWADLGLDIALEEIQDVNKAMVRVGFLKGDGAWSYVGKEISDYKDPSEPTMNFGWDIRNDVETVVHEFGHTLGLEHEHQNPKAGIVWDEELVYTTLATDGANNWDRETTFHNIIEKIPMAAIEGSTWDPASVMHYPFDKGMIKEPAKFTATGIDPVKLRKAEAGVKTDPILSKGDRATVQDLYGAPKLTSDLQLLVSQPVELKAGEQASFTYTPTASGKQNIGTLGDADTVLVLNEVVGGKEVFRAGDDDSGLGSNALVTYRFVEGHKYVARLRLYSKIKTGKFAVMVWPA